MTPAQGLDDKKSETLLKIMWRDALITKTDRVIRVRECRPGLRRGNMAFEISPARPRHDHLGGLLNGREADGKGEAEISALRAENAELRKVVIALTRLVVRNVLRNEAGV
jgi:hypothetical protein